MRSSAMSGWSLRATLEAWLHSIWLERLIRTQFWVKRTTRETADVPAATWQSDSLARWCQQSGSVVAATSAVDAIAGHSISARLTSLSIVPMPTGLDAGKGD